MNPNPNWLDHFIMHHPEYPLVDTFPTWFFGRFEIFLREKAGAVLVSNDTEAPIEQMIAESLEACGEDRIILSMKEGTPHASGPLSRQAVCLYDTFKSDFTFCDEYPGYVLDEKQRRPLLLKVCDSEEPNRWELRYISTSLVLDHWTGRVQALKTMQHLEREAIQIRTEIGRLSECELGNGTRIQVRDKGYSAHIRFHGEQVKIRLVPTMPTHVKEFRVEGNRYDVVGKLDDEIEKERKRWRLRDLLV